MFFTVNKKICRLRRSLRTRSLLRKLNVTRLVVHRTSRHIYAQIIMNYPSHTIVSASTLEKNVIKDMKYTGNKKAASVIGKCIAIRALQNGVKKVSFDRSGFKYHGRILELATAARKFGLIF